MAWLKDFIDWAYKADFHKKCSGSCCKNVWEAAVIINSAKKQKILIKDGLIEMDEQNRFALKPTFQDLSEDNKNSIFNDFLSEILELKEQFLNKKDEYRKIMIFLMRLFFYNQRLEQLEQGLLYNYLDTFYKKNKTRITSG
jgi:hypothetical protein